MAPWAGHRLLSLVNSGQVSDCYFFNQLFGRLSLVHALKNVSYLLSSRLFSWEWGSWSPPYSPPPPPCLQLAFPGPARLPAVGRSAWTGGHSSGTWQLPPSSMPALSPSLTLWVEPSSTTTKPRLKRLQPCTPGAGVHEPLGPPAPSPRPPARGGPDACARVPGCSREVGSCSAGGCCL